MMALIVKPTIAQEAITVKPTTLCDGFEIKFKMPEYTVVDTNMLETYGIDRTYSLINVNHKDFHNFAEDLGCPTLPAFTIALPICDSANEYTITTSFDIMEYAENLKDSEFVQLPHDLMPIQGDEYKNDTVPMFSYNSKTYNPRYGRLYYEPFVADAFSIMGQSGVYITFCPFVYNTGYQSIAAIDSITITFTYTGNFGSKSDGENSFIVDIDDETPTYRNSSVSKIDESFINDIFDYTPIVASATEHSAGAKGSHYTIKNVIDNNSLSGSLECIDNDDYVTYVEKAETVTNAKLLIISAPGFIEQIKPYVNYKRYQGYKVALVKTSNSISRETLSHFLRIYLQKTDAKPNYVLLVGGTNKDAKEFFIPFMGNTAGSIDRTYNPANDYEYAMCREDNSSFWNALKNTVIKWRGQYFHIGRFNAETKNELRNVIYHTICSEQNYQLNKPRILKITSHGQNMCFAGGALGSIEFKEVEEYHLKRDTKEEFEKHIHSDLPWWLIVYNGHGDTVSTEPYGWHKWIGIEEYCRNKKDMEDTICHDESYPIMFFQACSTGAYGNSEYFGAQSTWRCSSAFIGASTTTGAEWGRVLLNKAFDHGNQSAWASKEHIGAFLDLARERAFKQRGFELQISGWSNRNYALSRFNLFGDPSMIIKGYTLNSLTFVDEHITNNKIYYKVLDTIDTNNSSVVVEGSDSELILKAGKKISLKPCFKISNGAAFKASVEEINKKY